MHNHEKYIIGQKFSSNANIELTNKCGLRCAQCVRAYLELPKTDKRHIMMREKIDESGDIPLQDLRKICEFFDNNISFCGQFSDPVFHKKFYDILRMLAEFPEKTFRIHTASNQKDLEWYRKAFELSGDNVIWMFGLDGLVDTSPIYRKGQNAQLIYDAMVLGASMGKRIVWQFIVFGHNEHQVPMAIELAKKHKMTLTVVKTDRTSTNIKPASGAYKPSVLFKDLNNFVEGQSGIKTKGIKESIHYDFNLPKV